MISIYRVCKVVGVLNFSSFLKLIQKLVVVQQQLKKQYLIRNKIVIIMKTSFISNLKQTTNPEEPGSYQSKPISMFSVSFDVEDYYQHYRLHQNLFTKSELENQDDFTVLKGKNYLYFGGLTNGVKHGWGVSIVGESLYEGEFEDNHKSGTGYQKQNNGVIYNGEFKNSLFEGNGTLTNIDGSRYTGDFKHGHMQGEGMWVNQDGDKYIGQWVGGKATGRGVLISSKNDKYDGQFKQFVKNGHGIQSFTNGDVFKGYYEGNTPNGYGQYLWKDGSRYKGMFKNGLKHGRGVWTSPNGDFYEGYYENDKKCGNGQMKWANGNIYIGQFFNDLRHGEGQMKWANGTQFKGFWQKGIPDGPGILLNPSKGVKRGIFKNNILVSKDIKDRDKYWKEPQGLRRTRKYKASDQSVGHYQKLKSIPQHIQRSRKKSQDIDEKTRLKLNYKQKSLKMKKQRFYFPPPRTNYKVIPYGYRNSSLGVGSRGFPIYIKPNLSLNSSPLTIKIRIQRTKRGGLDITAKQVSK